MKNIAAEKADEPPNVINANKEDNINAEKVISTIEISSKVRKPAMYDKAISNPIHF